MKVYYGPTGWDEPCDKCGLKDPGPTFEFHHYCRENGHNYIWIHERCLEKAIAAAKRRALKAQEVSK